MKSLKANSLRVLTEEVNNLPTLLKILDSNPSARDAADNDLAFWQDILVRCMWERDAEEMILLRGDLKSGAAWKIVCGDLVKGNAYYYSWFTNGSGENFIEPAFSINATALGVDPAESIFQGTLPLPGTPTICVMFWSPNELGVEQNAFVFGTSGRDALERAIRWVLDIQLVHKYQNDDISFIEFDLVLPIKENAELDMAVELLADQIEAMEKSIRMVNLEYTSFDKPKKRGMTFSSVIPFPE